MVDYYVLRLYVSVHYPIAVSIVQPLQHLIDVELAVLWAQDLQQLPVLRCGYVLHHQAEHLAFFDDVQ